MKAPSKQRLRLIIIDPQRLLPDALLAEVAAQKQLTLADAAQRITPHSVALLVIDDKQSPASALHSTFAGVPMHAVVYDTAPSLMRESNAFNAGAKGYIIPGATLHELLPILELARSGGFAICSGTLALLHGNLRAPVDFSRREQEVVVRMSLGAGTHDIAQELKLSHAAVEETLDRACRKAGVETHAALASWWTRWILTDDFGGDEDEDEGELPPMLYAMTA